MVEPTGIAFRRYDTGVRVGYTRWGSRMTRDHGAPYYLSHPSRGLPSDAPSARPHCTRRTNLPRRHPFVPSSPILPSREARASRSRVAKCSMRVSSSARTESRARCRRLSRGPTTDRRRRATLRIARSCAPILCLRIPSSVRLWRRPR